MALSQSVSTSFGMDAQHLGLDRAERGNLVAAGQDRILVPDGEFLRGADYARVGKDLVLRGDGAETVIEGFYAAEKKPALVALDGSRIEPDLAMALAQAYTPYEVAQAGGAPAGASIGEIKLASGTVNAVRGGQTVQLQAGSQVQQGDLLQTGGNSKVTVQFADGTTFALDSNARMVLDRMIYNPATKSGNSLFSVVQGAFVFVSGEIAKTDPTQMLVRTPVATIGIRGTGVGGQIRGEGFLNSFTVLTGIIVLLNSAGNQVLDDPGETVSVQGNSQAFSQTQVLSPAEIEQQYGLIIQLLNQFVPVEKQIQIQTVPGSTPQDSPLNDHQQNQPRDNRGDTQNIAPPTDSAQSNTPTNITFADRDDQLDDAPPPAPVQTGGPITGTAGDDVLVGTAGDDIILGLGGNDQLFGQAGNDLLVGGAGDDLVNGGDGNDVIVAGEGEGDDIYIGGDGFDVLTYTSVPTVANSTADDLFVDLQNNVVAGAEAFIGSDAISGIEGVLAGGGNDTLIGNNLANLLSGGDGDDILAGAGGDDTLIGGNGNDTVVHAVSQGPVLIDLNLGIASGAGIGNDALVSIENANGTNSNDTLIGNAGDNILNGNGGVDLVDFSSAGGAIHLQLGGANGTGDGTATGDGNDVIRSIEEAVGSIYDDTIIGSSAANRMSGNDGNDWIAGRDADDSLFGDQGNDTLSGGNGTDFLTGGAGNDVFRYENRFEVFDRILDFDSGSDKILVDYATFGGTNLQPAPGVLTDGVNFEYVSGYDGSNGQSTNAIAGKANFIYDTDTKALYQDSNGNAAGGYTVVATFEGTSEAPTANDIQTV